MQFLLFYWPQKVMTFLNFSLHLRLLLHNWHFPAKKILFTSYIMSKHYIKTWIKISSRQKVFILLHLIHTIYLKSIYKFTERSKIICSLCASPLKTMFSPSLLNVFYFSPMIFRRQVIKNPSCTSFKNEPKNDIFLFVMLE